MSATFNRRVLLARRPRGEPVEADFRLEQGAVPQPAAGQVLLRTRYLSLDPYMRGRMNDTPSYVPPIEVGAPMSGQTVSVIEASGHPAWRTGELVLANSGWQDYSLSDGGDLRRLPPDMARPSWALGVLGMPGLTAYVGLLDIGQPRRGETVVVAAATGAVGSLVGQIARLQGCRVVGIAGGANKCRYAREELGFDACVDHRSPELAARLKEACPQGIDVYFENVGGAVLRAVMPLLNVGARVPVCGLIAWYNAERAPEGPDYSSQLLLTVLRSRVKLQGFIIFDHYERSAAFSKDMGAWLAAGGIRYREDVVQGLEQAPRALIGLLRGENFGKLVVEVSR
ncbi:MAG: NADP-dependent oxidoreductase [Proteobacteria bacterium]|nr:NADP-dependent oxidoreductase [Pseudomonadota bacterium]